MRSLAYKTLIWNSSWYKKYTHQPGSIWAESLSPVSDSLLAESKAESEVSKLLSWNALLAWWRGR